MVQMTQAQTPDICFYLQGIYPKAKMEENVYPKQVGIELKSQC